MSLGVQARTPRRPSDVGVVADVLRSAEVATQRDDDTVSALTLTSGTIWVALARARTAGTFTRIRFALGSTAPGGTYTDCRAGVWGADYTTQLAQTANEVATVTGSSAVKTLTLLSSVTLTEGQFVGLGLGFIASTAPTVRGLALATGVPGLITPPRSVAKTGWLTTTSLTTDVSGAASSAVPWLQLLP